MSRGRPPEDRDGALVDLASRPDLPLPLRTDSVRGPWARIDFLRDGPRKVASSDPVAASSVDDANALAFDAVVRADPTPGPPGSVRRATREDQLDGPFSSAALQLLASPPAWPGQVPDLAPGAPGGDNAAFGQTAEDVQLAACYASALAMAERCGVGRLVFLALGRGQPGTAAGFPIERAAKIALGHAVGHFARRPPPDSPATVVFAVNDEEARVHRHLIETRAQWAAGRRRA